LIARALLLAAALLAGTAACRAGSASPRLCDQSVAATARQQDRLLRFAAVVRSELEASGQGVALVARSGLNLDRFGVRYSHAGISLKASANAAWSVRQLYYACDERRPRLYDQGLPGFVLGTDDAALGYVSLVLLPPDEAAELERTALDKARALRLLAATYSANAYPFSLRYQNCNQWVMELLASAWGGLADTESLRADAQRWLQQQGYVPSVIEVGSRLLMFIGGFIPWVHVDDHPEQDRFDLLYRISMPASIEAFVRERLPGAQRVEICHTERVIVVHRGWDSIATGCRAGVLDTVISLDT
jgi:hypothetical protein